MSEILAIIPARGGSKGLPDKNILPLLNHPLITYSIKAALDAKKITRVIVSTDSEKIADISLKYGAEVPFVRPAEFAQDWSTDLEVFKHSLTWLKQYENYVPDLVVQLRPTSPFRKIELIDECIDRLIMSDADSLRIITQAPISPYKMWTLSEENPYMKPLLTVEGLKEAYNEPRQRLPKVYWQIGTLDVIRTCIITENNSMSGNKILPYLVEPVFAVDIDDLQSFKKAEEVILNNNCVKFDQ